MPRTNSHRETFIGRHDQMRALFQALDDTMGEPDVRCVVSGGSGIGRTALLGAFTRACRARGSAALELSCSPPDGGQAPVLADGLLARLAARSLGGVSFGPQWERSHVRGFGGATEIGGWTPAATRAARSADGHVGGPAPGRSADVSAGAGGSATEPGPGLSAASIHAAVRVVSCKAPFVLTLDDADRAGPALLESVRRVREACAGLPLLLVLTVRSGQSPRAPLELADAMYGARRLTLDGLSPRESGELLHARSGHRPGAEFSAACHRLTGGNPFLLAELGAQLRGTDGLPDPAELDHAAVPVAAEVLLGRVARADPHAVRLAQALAVVGRADAPLLAQVSGLGLVETLNGLDLLVRTGLVTDTEEPVLRHPLLARTFRESMTQMARNAAHLTAALHLHEHHAPAERVARHLSASTVAQNADWSAEVMMRAAASARDAGHDDTARRYLELVAETASGAQRRQSVLELADHHLRHGPGGTETVVAMLHRTDDDALRGGLLGRLSRALTAADPSGGGTEPPHSVAAALRGTAFEGWDRLHLLLSRLPELPAAAAAELFDDLPARLRPGAPDGGSPLLAASRAFAAYYRNLADDDPRTSAAWARAALRCPPEDLDIHPLASTAALAVLVDGGQRAEAAGHLERLGGQVAQGVAEDPGLAWVRAQLAFAEGDLPAARGLLAVSLEALGVADPAGRGWGALVRVAATGLLANVLLTRGERAEAQLLLQRDDRSGPLPADGWSQDVLLARARLWAVNGDLAAARRSLAALRALHRTAGLRAAGTASWRVHGVELLARTGLTSEARTLTEEQLRFARLTGSDLELGRARRALARVCDPASAEQHLRAAVALLEPLPAAMDLAAALADLGAVRAAGGHREDAVAVLTRAVRLAERCGAGDLALRVRQQILAASGDTARYTPLRGVLSLTPREREILVDALHGLTNKRISARRDITSRTVELHLSSAYRKLGISGRGDFGTVFRVPGLWALLTDPPPADHHAERRAPGSAAAAGTSVPAEDPLRVRP